MSHEVNQEQKLKWWGMGALILSIFFALYPFPDIGPLQAFASRVASALFFVAVVVAAFDCGGNLEPYEFGRRTFLGRQWGEVRGPGPYITIPLFGGLVRGDTKLRTIEVNSVVVTRRSEDDTSTTGAGKAQKRAGIEVSIEGSVQYMLTKIIRDGQIVCLGVTQEAIEEGLRNAIQTKIIAFGGEIDGEELVANVPSIRDFVNAALQCGTMPHFKHPAKENPETGTVPCTVAGCTFGDGKAIPSDELLEFYRTHFHWLRPVIAAESKNTSSIENQYGITVVVGGYEIGKIGFSSSTQDSFETAQRAKRLAEAVRTKTALAKQAKKDVGLDPAAAAAFVETTMVGARHNVLTVNGVGPEIGVLADAIAGLGKQQGGKKS